MLPGYYQCTEGKAPIINVLKCQCTEVKAPIVNVLKGNPLLSMYRSESPYCQCTELKASIVNVLK